MSEIASASINSFGIASPEADFVPPTEEPIFVLTGFQLAAIVAQAIQEATQGLQDRIEVLEGTVASQSEKIVALESTQDKQAENELFQLRLINSLREAVQKTAAPTPPNGAKTIARIAKLKDFLKTRGGGATFQECERLLGIKPNQMTALITKLDKRSFEVFTRAGDGRQRVIRLKVQIASRER